MKKTQLLIVSGSLFCAFGSFAQTFIGRDAESRIQDAEQIEYSENLSRPTFIEFKSTPSNFRLAVSNPVEAMKQVLSLKSTDDLVSYKQEKDDLGFTHTRYQQLYKNIPVEGGEYIAHQKSGVLDCINGTFFTIGDLSVSPSLTEAQALSKALTFVGAKKYKWENKEEIAELRKVFDDPTYNYDPTGELVIYAKNIQVSDKADFRLAYKFNIYAELPESRAYIFVDAKTGEIVGRQELIHTADVQGTAHTKYSGDQKIMTTLNTTKNTYVLQETGRGTAIIKGQISTFNANNAPETNPTYPSTDFEDPDNDWNNVNAKIDEVATDAHWATEMTYDYFLNVHGRNSVNNAGMKLVNYVHCGTNWFNANWNGSFMRYGDGPNKLPLTAIDIGAHEMTHGVTGNSAGLVYAAEYGALNESFSDIFGTCVEWMAKPTKADWDMGADIGALRSLQYPKSHANPDTYKGVYWVNTADSSTTNDNGGVHTNSGVQNKWFYILTMGEQGINDNNKTYSVKGIGIDKAAKIAYRNLTVYLGKYSNYASARTGSLKAAKDLYTDCSPEFVATAYAWDAVGVTGAFACNVGPIAGFNSAFISRCDANIQFKDLSSGTPTSWTWDFGDGQTSNTQNPAHKYTASGTYTVKLTATNANGNNVETKTAYVVIDLPKGPTVSNAQRCGPGVVNLSAASTNGGSVNWFADPSGGTSVNTGTTYSPNLTNTTTYYVENTLDQTPQKVGAVDSNALARGGLFTANYIHGLYFDVLSPATIKSVKVYSGEAGNRVIDVVDVHGEPVLTKTVNIPAGEQRVTLDFDLPVGTQYFLKVSGTLLNLQRAKGGASFPYTIANLISITETDIKATAPGSYYFFYDWEVVKSGCIGPRIPVIGTINPDVSKPTITEANKILNAPSGAGYTYQWYLNSNEIPGATGQTYAPTLDGNYTVKVTGTGNCSNISDIYIFKANGIHTTAFDAAVKIYPNPASETLYIEAPLNGSNMITVSVYSVIGKLVYQENYSTNGQAHALNLGSIHADGIYFLKIQSGSETITRKFNLNR